MVWSDCGYNAGETLVLLPGLTVESEEQNSSELYPQLCTRRLTRHLNKVVMLYDALPCKAFEDGSLIMRRMHKVLQLGADTVWEPHNNTHNGDQSSGEGPRKNSWIKC